MASNRAILPKNIKKLEGLAGIIRREQANIANLYHKRQLEEVVAPFDSRITFRTLSRYRNGDYVTNIAPTDEIAGLNAADTPVTSKELFNWLDAGTSVTTVVMPDEFSNETIPNSIFTSHADYDRKEIYFSGNVYPGMDARNFLKLVGDMFENVYRNNMNNAIRSYLS